MKEQIQQNLGHHATTQNAKPLTGESRFVIKSWMMYKFTLRKIPKIWTPKQIAVIILKL